MADNFPTNPGSGGVTLAADDIGGVYHPRTKIGHGVDGSYVDVSAANPLPVAGAFTVGPAQQTASGAVLVGNAKNKLRDEFPTGGLNPAVWQTVQTGAGQTISTGNGTTGSYLLLSSGTTANAETIIRSVEMFTLPIRLAAFVTASQRIANTEFFIEILEVDPATGLPILAATSQTNAGFGRNHASVKFDGTSATSALVTARSGGAPEFVSAASTITTTAATGSGPNWFPAGFVELQLTGEHVALLQNAIDATTQAAMARRVTQAAPDPNATYKLQFRLRNLGTAPASSTDYRVHAIRLFDYTRHTVEVIGGPGHNGPAQAVPVNIAGGTTAVTGSVTATGVAGTAAHDAAISGNPVRIAGRAVTANYTATATGDTADFITTTVGAQIVRLNSIPELDWQTVTTLTTTTAAALRAAAGAGIKAYMTGLQYQNTNATATQVNILRGTTVIASYFAPANMAVPATITLLTPLQTAVNEALNVQAVTTGASVLVSAQGFVSP